VQPAATGERTTSNEVTVGAARGVGVVARRGQEEAIHAHDKAEKNINYI